MNAEEIKKMVKSPMFKNMMGDQAEEIEKQMQDPKMVQKMTGFWKQLDNMAATDEKSYHEFIDKQKKEFDEEEKKKCAEREKQRIVTSEPICSIKIRPSKILEPKEKKTVSDTIKLFDTSPSDINKSFVYNESEGTMLEQPKIYLNVVHHAKVLAPVKANKEPADPDNDAEWNIIPISFGSNKERWSGSGMKCIHIEAHVNTCVFKMFKKGPKKIGALTNYIIERFQHLLRDHYVFHKKSIKILKNHKYKAWRGAHDIVPDYVLPEAYHIDHHKKAEAKMKKKMDDLKKQMGLDKEPQKDFKKDDVQMPTRAPQDEASKKEEEDKAESKIIIPGITPNKDADKVKKPVIMEMQSSDKYTPNFTVKDIEEDG